MIASVSGRILHKDAQGVTVDCGGVGYGVFMSLSALARLGSEGDEVVLLVHTHLAQDSLRLYGFLDAAEKRCFEVLIATPGVGPKLALAILSTLSSAELTEVVARADGATLVRIPGVGKKKADRLLLELKDRLPKIANAEGAPPAGPGALRDDLASALTGLGFKATVAEKAADAAMQADPQQKDIARLVRSALRASTQLS